MCELSTALTTYGMLWRFWNSVTNLSIMLAEGHLINFFNNNDFIVVVNWETAAWLVERPILYKFAMFCIELHVANLDMDTSTFTWTGTANRKCVFFLVGADARVVYKYSNVDTSMRIRPLNDPNKFWSKKPGRCNPLLWAHKLRGRDARSR